MLEPFCSSRGRVFKVIGVFKEFTCDSLEDELVLMVYEDGKVFANEGNRLHLTNNNLKEPLNMASSSQEPKSTIEVKALRTC
ncbi:hypothetical protein HF521_011782 [Silurus meridionalis]|uniref:Uncharacterized protein n=1 Tax=Silurus meridionalis TaxID=175797 RepID=A0A8T0AF93_SILME|nr:hypothetical protein HF521_011782 [Silurus meridionalis]